MKILVDKMPRRLCVEKDCIFAEKTGQELSIFNFDFSMEWCKCKISGFYCDLQLDGKCPYLKEQNDEDKDKTI